MTKINITLPIYHQVQKKITLLSMNSYRNWHFHIQNRVKKEYSQIIKYSIKDKLKIKGKYQVEYKLFYKNSKSDLMNVISIVDKFLNDVLQEIGIVENDNVNFYKKASCEVIEVDKKNPRIEVEIKEVV